MSHIFLSYARSTAPQVQQIAEALRALGYEVWRDDELPAHRAYAEVIEERLAAAAAVVVVWSAEAARSEWVQSEADRARKDRKLVQLTLDAAPLPMPFDRIECADLTGWAGEADRPGWRKVLASVADLASGPAPAPAAPDPKPAPRGLSICVLPFANMSGDAEQEYFSDGVSEDIITDLSKVSALSVVSRNSAFQFKGQHVDVRQVARQLGVTHVLEGSVRKAGSRVRITAQLIEAASDSHLWAERYDRELTDIFALQDEISQAIVAALRLKLLPAEKTAIERRATSDPDAYNLFLMARRLWVSGNNDVQGLEAVARLCRRAIEIDPSYAYAWALLAQSQMMMHFRHGLAGDQGLESAEQALSLNPDLAEAHAVKATYLIRHAQHDDANAEIELALRLDPESYEVNSSAAYLAFRQQRIEDAIRYYETAAALMETSFSAPSMLVTCYAALGDAAGKARAARMTFERAEKARAQDQSNGQALGASALALAALGDARARDFMSRALLIDPDNRPMRYNLACATIADLDDPDGAIALLGPYLATATPTELGHLAVDPDMDRLRDDPRLKAMVAEAEARVAAS